MRRTTIKNTLLPLLALFAGIIISSCSQSPNTGHAQANEKTKEQVLSGKKAKAYFAGGCFWCVEADFEKLPGVYEAISGYSGGTVENPTYKEVTHTETGHLESVEVIYDPSVVTYRELVDYFLRHIDPTDDGGQFCDRGSSYKTAIFVENKQERKDAEDAFKQATPLLNHPIETPIVQFDKFWVAEDYHQDYYKKNPVRYGYYRRGCGRDRRIEQVWGEAKTSHEG